MNSIKNVLKKYLDKLKKIIISEDDYFLYLCSGEALPETLSEEDERY